MSHTIYWAVKLDTASVSNLLACIPPKHTNVYAEHITLAFKPTKEQEQQLLLRHGEEVMLKVEILMEDNFGQAVMVSGIERLDNGIPHITISCADGIKPVYSNKLLSKNVGKNVDELKLTGRIACYTNKGWA